MADITNRKQEKLLENCRPRGWRPNLSRGNAHSAIVAPARLWYECPMDENGFRDITLQPSEARIDLADTGGFTRAAERRGVARLPFHPRRLINAVKQFQIRGFWV